MLGVTEVLVLLFTFLVTYAFFSANRRPKNYPPGPFQLPIVGYMPFMNKKSPLTTFRNLTKKYGEAFSLRIGCRNFVYLNKWSLAKEAFNHPDIQGRPHFYTIKFLKFGHLKGVAAAEGDLWLEHRRFTLRHLRDFGFGKLSFEYIILREMEKVKKSFSDMAGKAFEITTVLNMAIVNIIWKMVADVELDCYDPSFVKLMKNIVAGTDIAANAPALDFLPWLRYFIPEHISGLDKLRQIRTKLYEFATELIEDHKKSFDESMERDFIDVFLKRMKEDEANNVTDTTFTDLQLYGVMAELFLAGSETTATTLKFAFLVLIGHPEIQKKVQKEILSVTNGKREVSLNDKNDLPYTEAFFMEVQRLCNIAPMGVPHRVTATARLGDYVFPKDTLVFTNIRQIHLDPQNWPEPEKFDPSRFLDEDGKVNRKIEAFLPFSIGKRQCLGESLAKAEVFLFLSNLLQEFSFTPPPGVNPPSPLDAVGGIIFHPPQYELIATPLVKQS